MNATERLRRLLDERGVEWRRTPHYSSKSIDNETVFRGEGIEWIANDHLDGHIGLRALRYQLTPEQAIAATLGLEPDDAAMVKLHDRMNAALLEYERAQGIEQRDGDSGVVVPFVAEMHRLLEEAATLGSCNCSNDCTNSERTGTRQKVYLVETSDDLIESWYPIGVYLHSKAAEDCAEAIRGEVDGIRQFARVVELKVVGE